MQELKEKNIELLSFESADMQLQYKLMSKKDEIRCFHKYAAEMTKKLKEIRES